MSHALQCMEIWGGSAAADEAVSTPGLDLYVHSRPHGQAQGGGDVHYVSLCGGGKITRFALADVAGHGEAVAALGRSLRDLMRRHINRKSQDRLVGELNRRFPELGQPGRFATAVVGTYLTSGDRLTLSNAGHPRPLWFRAALGEWSFVSGGEGDSGQLANLPLGVDDTTAYPRAELSLGKGDLVLVYTDALIEAVGGDGRPLGEAGLLELVRSLDAANPAGLPATLTEKLERHRGGARADDDLTFLLLSHNAGAAPKLGLLQTLDVYAKVLGLKRV